MDYKEITELIKFINKSNISELRIEHGEFKIVIRSKGTESNGVYQQPMIVAQPAPVVAVQPQMVEAPKAVTAQGNEKPDATSSGKSVTIKSPMVGTFYRSPAPDKEPFVKVGDKIEKGKVLCVIEAMKLFNEIESEISGTIVRIVATDAGPIEYDQVMFEIEP